MKHFVLSSPRIEVSNQYGKQAHIVGVKELHIILWLLLCKSCLSTSKRNAHAIKVMCTNKKF